MRNFSRPRRRSSSGATPWTFASSTACSPASWICLSTSSRALEYISSILAGWMRPSATSFDRVRRAISRRTVSKPESTTASGVSSMMKSIPVRFSRVRMLRPSRPMMRPFMSSDGKLDDRHGGVGHMAGGRALDADGQDVPGPAIALVPGLFLDGPDHLGHVVPDLVFGPLEDDLGRLVSASCPRSSSSCRCCSARAVSASSITLR